MCRLLLTGGSYSYEFLSLTSRAINDRIEYQALNSVFIFENQRRSESAFNSISIIPSESPEKEER